MRAPLTLCETLFPEGFQADVSHVVVAVVQRGLALPSRSLADQASHSPPRFHVSHVSDSLDSCSRRCVSFGFVLLGQRAVVDQCRPSLIDRSVEPVNDAFPSCSWQILALLPWAPDSHHNALVLPPTSTIAGRPL